VEQRDLWSFLEREGLIDAREAEDLRQQHACWTPLGEILVAEGALSRSDLQRLLARQGSEVGARFGELAVQAGLCTWEEVSRALAIQREASPVDHLLARCPPRRLVESLLCYARHLESLHEPTLSEGA
jgi:hypothetical protein